MKSIAYILLAISAAFIALIVFYTTNSHPKASPLTNFSAPFVFGRFVIPDDNPLTNEAVELGRLLFYDVRLSGDNSTSCANCHIQKLAFTDGKKTAIGVSKKALDFNSMSLANLMWGPQHFFWDGRSNSLEQQALMPIENVDEMDQRLDLLVKELAEVEQYKTLFKIAFGEINQPNIGKALAAFQRTLISSNSKYDQFLRGQVSLTKQEEKGRQLFMAHPDAKANLRGGNCIDCHSQFLTAGFSDLYDGFSNNGLDEEEKLLAGLQAVTGKASDKGLFKVPTLRNIALTAPYMHDGRFNTLKQVLDHYNEGIKNSSTLSPLISEADNRPLELTSENQKIKPSLNLTEREKEAIIAFLHTLTDQQFINNPKFSDPFIRN